MMPSHLHPLVDSFPVSWILQNLSEQNPLLRIRRPNSHRHKPTSPESTCYRCWINRAAFGFFVGHLGFRDRSSAVQLASNNQQHTIFLSIRQPMLVLPFVRLQHPAMFRLMAPLQRYLCRSLHFYIGQSSCILNRLSPKTETGSPPAGQDRPGEPRSSDDMSL